MTTNLPTTVSYTLEDILDRFEQKMDKQFAEVNDKMDRQFAEVNQKLNKLEIGQVGLSGEIKTLEEKINGIGKRIDSQEFFNRGLTIALIVLLTITGAAKLFGWLPTS